MNEKTGYLNLLVSLLVLAGYLVLAPSAHAHVQQGQAVSFMTGLEHPWSGLDHVLAMIAVGLWGAQLGNPAIWTLPITFPLVMSLGAMMGLLGIPLPGIEIGIAVSAIVLGIMVLGEVRPKLLSAVLPYFTAMPTARNFRPGRAEFSTAWDLSLPPAVCTALVSLSV
jgi:hydrogenase/urease accessory protein HupE